MITTKKSRQQGFSIISLIILGAIVGFLLIIGSQAAPTATEYMSIRKAVKLSIKDASTPAEIRASFDRAASASYIETITGKDLQITQRNDRIVVSFYYEKEIHIGGPVFLLIKYQGSEKG